DLMDRQPNIRFEAARYYLDILILECCFEEALEWESQVFTVDDGEGWNLYLNFLLLTGRPISGLDLAKHLTIYVEPRTTFLETHFDELADYCREKLEFFEQGHNIDLLRWAVERHPECRVWKWNFFVGISYQWQPSTNTPYAQSGMKMYRFSAIPEFKETIKIMLSDIENRVRYKLGLPAIGEGWISEADMVRMLRSALAPLEVQSQASFPWLGAQRFDAFVPQMRLAVEYMGRQHYEPIEFFGGSEGLIICQERDKRKARISLSNGVMIEYIRYDENLKERINEIVKKYARSELCSPPIKLPEL
ncbi:MAG: hypothetical protein ABIC40_04820, partial [bacterium]